MRSYSASFSTLATTLMFTHSASTPASCNPLIRQLAIRSVFPKRVSKRTIAFISFQSHPCLVFSVGDATFAGCCRALPSTSTVCDCDYGSYYEDDNSYCSQCSTCDYHAKSPSSHHTL